MEALGLTLRGEGGEMRDVLKGLGSRCVREGRCGGCGKGWG